MVGVSGLDDTHPGDLMLLRCLVLVLFGFNLISCGGRPITNAGADNPPTPGESPPPPAAQTMQEALQGTWCYYSAANGYPYYLGLIINEAGFSAMEVYRSHVLPDGKINQ